MKKVFLFFAVLAFLSGCKKGCDKEAGSTVVSDTEKTMVTNYLATNSITNAVQLSNSGLYYVITAQGDSKKPGQCDYVSVKYKGFLENGSVFEDATTTPASFYLYQLVEGWRRGIPLIGKGGKIKLFIPPSLAYGPGGLRRPDGTYVIPANQIIIFEIELMSI
ncbi:MAG: FKBP-type peptidyl-prolyl cis-trans isomerase [Chitinophagaceae bacterium]